MGLQKCEIFNEGWMTLEVGEDIFRFKVYHGSIKGLITGSRSYRASGTIVVYCTTSLVKGVVSFEEEKSGLGKLFGSTKSKLKGEIYEYNPEIHA